jgi:phosphodiesterase/alkaline phosphatase D-like protein
VTGPPCYGPGRLRRVGRTPLRLGGIAIAVAFAVPGSAFGANGFIDGVTAGEVTNHSAIVWAQTKKPGKVTVTAKSGKSKAAATLKAKESADDTVQVKLTGLKPGKEYTYRFCLANKSQVCSDTGHLTTAPKPSQAKTIRFAYSGDETGASEPGQPNPLWGKFRAFKSMAAEHNAFNIDLGDTIYSDPEQHGTTVSLPPTALSVKQKWAMYRKKLAIKNMRKVREAAGLYNHWDDHEFINDFSIPENGRKLYNRGVKAFRDYEPVTYTRKTGIYRSFRWGKNLELFFLDERSFRSAKASAGGVCNNPMTGQPDLAPTAPQSTRNVFAAIVPSLSQPVSPACLAAINSPQRTMLGHRQLNAFLKAVKSSTARWKVVMNEVPIQQFYALPYDRWEGYAFERVKLLSALQSAGVDHLVFLTTDTHASFLNVIRFRTLAGDSAPSNAPASPTDSPFNEYVTGPVATKPFAQEINDTVSNPSAGMLIEQAFFKPQPPNGVGMQCAQGNANSYVEVTVKKDKLKIDYHNQNGGPLLDVGGTTRCGPYVLTH